jgi:two-component system, OmpR family, sensor histidine kinase ChvG
MAPGAEAMPRSRPRRPRRRFSSLTWRILAPNVLALAILVGGVFYLDQYRDALIEAKILALESEAEIVAGALGESALAGPAEAPRIEPRLAGAMIGRLAESTRTRARLFAPDGALVADSRALTSAGREVRLRVLPPPSGGAVAGAFRKLYDSIAGWLPTRTVFPVYLERPGQRADDYAETATALNGRADGAVRQDQDGELVLSVAVPVHQLHHVLGALMLSTDGSDIVDGVRRVRIGIIEAFALTLGVTVLLSMFLAGTIARPVRRLARAAERVRRWRGERVEIPDLSRRRDEIGDLSAALREMTAVLYARIEAIESFAADVAHEIKNPLTSLRSAVESLGRTDDALKKARLTQVITDDVRRLDRLITDISNASRIDADLLRADTESVDLKAMLETAVEVYRERMLSGRQRFELVAPGGRGPVIEGVSGRLGQVIENLVANAVSFSPPEGLIRLSLTRRDGSAEIMVEDEGPGLPEGHTEALFERFYSKRPAGEAFGRHSGLGLSIARQIVEAHGGSIEAANRRDSAGGIRGARFIVRLPL